ncbi:MAG: protein-L-isoaspartate O-methyltransferase [Casimicrobiaceae bacterium]|nr:protein-L-isoaspartate O-methyltransferase [Casimicrobiaceae bacterium]MCX8098744.1 protein-L-isoaspartate O-methyltransferase [Casimicrobiaceae bacterium]MDW8313179.1 protein-L-isoaspartate O-methyltransferase [Burkholderiales bacterium]
MTATPETIEERRFKMVEQQIRPWNVLDTDVLDLLYRVKREQFVPPEQRALAFVDMETPLAPVSATERMWPPKLEARVLQELRLRGSERVLEVGTGSGYFTALLAARSAQVISVEIDPALAAFAAANLKRAGVSNVELLTGDGSRGLSSHAPFDVIVFTGSMEVLPEAIEQQLTAQGKLFAILGKAPMMTATLFTRTSTGTLHSVGLFETWVAPLVNAPRAQTFVF